MSKGAKLGAAVAAALVLAFAVWMLTKGDPSVPTATAPRGEFASDKASDER